LSMGWICPVCGQGNAPSLPTCMCKSVEKTLGIKTSGPVIDPYAGTGTTFLAAKELDRECWLIEQNGEYVEHLM
jgi:hypothetical protein